MSNGVNDKQNSLEGINHKANYTVYNNRQFLTTISRTSYHSILSLIMINAPIFTFNALQCVDLSPKIQVKYMVAVAT